MNKSECGFYFIFGFWAFFAKINYVCALRMSCIDKFCVYRPFSPRIIHDTSRLGIPRAHVVVPCQVLDSARHVRVARWKITWTAWLNHRLARAHVCLRITQHASAV